MEEESIFFSAGRDQLLDFVVVLESLKDKVRNHFETAGFEQNLTSKPKARSPTAGTTMRFVTLFPFCMTEEFWSGVIPSHLRERKTIYHHHPRAKPSSMVVVDRSVLPPPCMQELRSSNHSDYIRTEARTAQPSLGAKNRSAGRWPFGKGKG